jgi:hypothetical protein
LEPGHAKLRKLNLYLPIYKLAELTRERRYSKGVEWIELVTMTIAGPSLLE